MCKIKVGDCFGDRLFDSPVIRVIVSVKPITYLLVDPRTVYSGQYSNYDEHELLDQEFFAYLGNLKKA